jgi:hypothetical protein
MRGRVIARAWHAMHCPSCGKLKLTPWTARAHSRRYHRQAPRRPAPALGPDWPGPTGGPGQSAPR